ncbi:hypothetical protein CLPU_3c00210 [Gottschalkia purinilytica]|uniref:Uncharacterized protein n=1 Tax=Gottschalkia purinilytica TaxID=1503 RepID=A0A0L0WCQ0_GOTPU|nr:hypothetical protein [Gottschalkia purinilytica]KNF09243.1 hypothetical protein CLPU_3c00210 [Gottschalkia purinilytica]
MDKELLEILKNIQDDIKGIKETQQQHTQILNNHSGSLNEHTQILNNHSRSLNEHTQILRALEHKSDVIKSEQENMKYDVAEIKRDVEIIRKDLCRVEEATANNWADIAKLKSIK